MADDYYEILQVSKNATADEIQKAYRKLARRYHPDLHAEKDDKEKEAAKHKFQRVQRAYDVLSDPKKRKLYDQLGPDFEAMGDGTHPFRGGASPMGQMDIDLSQLFGGGGAGRNPAFEDIMRQFGGMGSGQPHAPRGPTKGRDLEQSITVSFATAVLGGKHQVSFQIDNGKVETLTVKIPAGIADGKKIRLRNQGGRGVEGGPRGDLLIKISVASHPVFTRSGLNLHITVPISVSEAALGAKIDLPTPYGTASVSVPAGSSSGKTLRMKGMGVRTAEGSGDLLVQLQIVLPETITNADRELIEQLGNSWRPQSLRDRLAW